MKQPGRTRRRQGPAVRARVRGGPEARADLSPPCLEANACGDCLPGCRSVGLGPCRGRPFPLASDGTDPNVRDDGVARDADGSLRLDPDVCRSAGGFAWIVNPTDWGQGTVSRLATTRGLAEVARYPQD